MWRAMVVVIAVAASGCRTPYQSMGWFRGGFEETPIAPGAYVVHVSVNGYTSQGSAISYAYRRAGELCPTGFDLVDSAQSASHSYVRTQYGVNEVSKPDVTIVVQCRVIRVPTS